MGASATATVPRQPPVTRKEIAGWCLYDAADSAFTTVIITAFYAPFFSKVIVGDPVRGRILLLDVKETNGHTSNGRLEAVG